MSGRPRRIAVIRALALGDLLCAIPTLRALRIAEPRAHVTLIGLPWAADLVGRFPHLLDDHRPFPGFPGIPEADFDAARTTAFLADAQADPFDLVVQLQGSGMWSNGFALLLGGRRTVGFHPPDVTMPSGSGDWIEYEPRGHEIQRLLRLVPAFGAGAGVRRRLDERLEFPIHAADRVAAQEFLDATGVGHDPYAVVHPGASVPARRWPPERFAAVAHALAAKGLRVVLTGTAAERSIAAAVASAARGRVADITGRTDLGTLAALLDRARIVVANDTGISHLAAARRTPSVIVFSASDPERWAPLDRVRHRGVGPAPGWVEVAAVVAEVDALLAAAARPAA